MPNNKTILIAIGGGDIVKSEEPMREAFRYLEKVNDPRMMVMTVATDEPGAAASKYNSFFRSRGLKHVDVVNVDQRDDCFKESSVDKMRSADAIFFTGGDQLNITSLMGGSPLHNLLHERFEEGVLIIGTSAGAAMMSSSMIISGTGDSAPRVSAVEIAPGMNLIDGTIIDSHFSERGRHGRLLTAVAHYPQALGLGIDENTAIIFRNGGFKVCGKGSVTVFDGSQMRYCDLPYRKENETIGMFGVDVHVLPSGYSYTMKDRAPVAPELRKMAGASDED